MDISDGTLKGTNNIMARLGVVLAVAAFDAVSSIATGGMYGALAGLSAGTGSAVSMIAGI